MKAPRVTPLEGAFTYGFAIRVSNANERRYAITLRPLLFFYYLIRPFNKHYRLKSGWNEIKIVMIFIFKLDF